MITPAPISVRGLTKRYGTTAALSDLSLEVPRGSIYGLLGTNGAGKTTTFRCLLGLLRPSSGAALLLGLAPGPPVFERVAYVPEQCALYDWMRGSEVLEMTRVAHRSFDALRARELTERFRLDVRKRVKHLSKGQKTALALVAAFAARPEVLVLDEPASGLDPVHQRDVLDLIIDAAAGGVTVLLSSHQIGQVERAVDRVTILDRGRVVLEGELDALKQEEKIVEAVFDHEPPALDAFARDGRVRSLVQNGRVVRLYARAEGETIAREIGALGPKSTRVLDQNLEDLFLLAVGRSE